MLVSVHVLGFVWEYKTWKIRGFCYWVVEWLSVASLQKYLANQISGI